MIETIDELLKLRAENATLRMKLAQFEHAQYCAVCALPILGETPHEHRSGPEVYHADCCPICPVDLELRL